MNEITTQSSTELSVLGGLAQEAQYYAKSIANGMIQLGRVLTEAKPLVKHGEWENWIRENAGCSVRYAQVFMQAYARFGNNAAVAQIGERGKIFKLLALPAGTEEQFLAENDVSDMSTREVEEAVRKVREELDAERRARALAEDQVRELMERPPEVPEEVKAQLKTQADTIASQTGEIQRLADIGRETLEETNRLRRENASLQREVTERDEMLAESQEEYNRLQGDLLNMQSMAAKGDAERVPVDTLTCDVLASAVRQFMGACARMPQMRHRFASMDLSEKNDWDELLRVIEKWAKDSRDAMNTIAFEEVIVHG